MFYIVNLGKVAKLT